jgi:hypothetical protein
MTIQQKHARAPGHAASGVHQMLCPGLVSPNAVFIKRCTMRAPAPDDFFAMVQNQHGRYTLQKIRPMLPDDPCLPSQRE